jgi:hypothetical protein
LHPAHATGRRSVGPTDYRSENDVHVLLGGFDDDVAVTLGPGVPPPDVRTVGDLRPLRAWSPRCVYHIHTIRRCVEVLFVSDAHFLLYCGALL